MNDITYSSSDTFFSTISNISILLKRSNFTLVFLKAACHANLSALKDEQDQTHIFYNTNFERS